MDIWKAPMGQSLHLVASEEEEYLPTAQFGQILDLTLSE